MCEILQILLFDRNPCSCETLFEYCNTHLLVFRCPFIGFDIETILSCSLNNPNHNYASKTNFVKQMTVNPHMERKPCENQLQNQLSSF